MQYFLVGAPTGKSAGKPAFYVGRRSTGPAVTDMEKAKRFYASAFGWAFNDYGPDYAGIRKPGGGEAGGLRAAPRVAAGGPLVVLYSENLESTFESVKKAGGAVTKPIFEFPGGRRFEFKDPSGNELAVWGK